MSLYGEQFTQENLKQLKKHFNIHKNIYNKALETLDNFDKFIPKYEMYNRLPDWKQTSNPEFQNVHSKAAQQTIGRIYRAIKNYQNKNKKDNK